jgi:hypothetical protein
MFGFFRRCLVFGASNPNKLLPEPGTQSPKPEPEARTREARTRTYPEPGAAGCPKPEHIPQQDRRAALIQPEQINASKCGEHKKTPAEAGAVGRKPDYFSSTLNLSTCWSVRMD